MHTALELAYNQFMKKYGSTDDWYKLRNSILKIFNRQALHAYSIEFIHPKTKDNVKYISPLPNDFSDAINILSEKYG